MRKVTVTLFLAAAATLQALSGFTADPSSASSHFDKDAKAPAKPSSPAMPRDEEQIQGDWVCTEFSQDNVTDATGRGFHAVFTDKEVKISNRKGGTVYKYRIDQNFNPGRCELSLGEVICIHGIYRLQGGVLTLALPKSTKGAYPDDFGHGEGRATYLFRRAADSAHRGDAGALAKEQAEALLALRKDLRELIALLDAEQYREFLEHLSPPQEREEAIRHFKEAARTKSKEELRKWYAPFAKMLGAISAERPAFDTTITRATFDLRGIHFNGLPGLHEICWHKVVERWYLCESAASGSTPSNRIEAKDAKACVASGAAWLERGQYDKAIADFDESIRVDPKCSRAYYYRGVVWDDKGQYEKAIADYNQALRLDPNAFDIYGAVAWLQATCPDAKYRDGRKAVDNASKACELTCGKSCWYIEALAAAYAESGEFEKARQWEEKAIGSPMPIGSVSDDDKQAMRSRLELYRQGKPYHRKAQK
jgi:uncharacterized protein (TIGR03067 family)